MRPFALQSGLEHPRPRGGPRTQKRVGFVTFASVVLDIPTRALDAAFDYAVPAALEAEAAAEASSCSGSLVGCTVLVPFSECIRTDKTVDKRLIKVLNELSI